MDELNFLKNYYDSYKKALFNNDMQDKFIELKKLLINTNNNGNKVIIAGNGASAAIASHCALDFTKQAKIRTLSFNEPSLITAFANDYGYENWVAKAIDFYCDPGDVAILISSSGKSPNIVNAAKTAHEKSMKVVAFSGFNQDNPLNKLGNIVFWVDTRAYNIIECIHMIWLTTVIDLIIGKSEYSVV